MKLGIHTPASATLGNRRTINLARAFRWDNRVVPDAVDIDGLWNLAQAPCYLVSSDRSWSFSVQQSTDMLGLLRQVSSGSTLILLSRP